MIDTTKNNNYVIDNFPQHPKYFEILLKMFRNYFSEGKYVFDGLDLPEKLKTDMELRFDYYLELYRVIQKYWIDIKDILNLFKLSQVVTQPGELFALFLNNQARACLELDNLKLNNRTYQDLYSAWCEYQKCLNGADSKQLMILVKRLKKKLPQKNDENILILELIAGVLPVEDVETLDHKNYLLTDSTTRKIRSNRSKF